MRAVVFVASLALASIAVAQPHPAPPVVFIHYDYMVATLSTGEHYSFAPSEIAVARMVEAFKRRGIQIVIDPQHTVIPYHDVISWGSCRPAHETDDQVNFFDLRAKYYKPHGNRPEHYAIFGNLGWGCGIGVTGMADLPGYNFMVTVSFSGYGCVEDLYNPCENATAGTFMHELGHNLDLRHGGDVDENFKPNYLSVMNYTYQTMGVPFATTPGSTTLAGFQLDYSDVVLPPLDETHIDERTGLGGSPTDSRLSVYTTCATTAAECGFPEQYVAAVAGPIDWNHNGIIESDVRVDANYQWSYELWHGSYLIFGLLKGFDDWTHVQQFLKTPAYATGHLESHAVACPIPRK